MKNKYFQFAESELTIYCGNAAMTNCSESLLQAAALSSARPKENILYLNTFLSARKLNANVKQCIPSAPPNLLFHSAEIGELVNEVDTLRRLIQEEKITCLILNSWEFAHKNYGCKERALYALMKLVNKFGISLLIYSQAKAAEAGKIQRGGLGRLSAFADAVIKLETPEEEPVSASPHTPIPPYPQTPEKLDAIKINELEYAQSESGVSSGGELVLPVEAEIMEEELMEV